MTKKPKKKKDAKATKVSKILAVAGALLLALITAQATDWYLHFLGSSGKATTCIGDRDPATQTFFQCVKRKMCEKGHLPFSTCHPPQPSN